MPDLSPDGARIDGARIDGARIEAARVLAGEPAAAALLAQAQAKMQALPIVPKLVVVRIGDDPASVYYTRMKARRAKKLGMASGLHELPSDVSETAVLELVASLNHDPLVSGILVQLPFPKTSAVSQAKVLAAIDPAKDVDGLHVANTGRLWADEPGLLPCTPAGVMALLAHYGIAVAGQHVVIVGRSHLVGKPLAGLMLRANATVTIAHSRTPDLAATVRQADVVVAAVGRPWLITAAMVRPGAVVVDVGINRVPDPDGGEDGKLVGDVHPEVAMVASALSPVPGGVGVMTVAQLLYNTVLAAEQQHQL
jgi:methylenetetrahydrofolate dehydrogenase (NADP+) / methenyltetrahydrofolate cyclohydrolase